MGIELDLAELFHGHFLRGPAQIIPGQIHQHDVLCILLFIPDKPAGQLLVLSLIHI